MNARWKYQLKWGLSWGMLMAVGMTAFNAFENENWNLFLTWNFVVRLLIFNALGVLVIGYYNWREVQKARSRNNSR